MPLPRIAVWFHSEDYNAIKSLSPDDADLPDTFDEWLEFATEQITKLEAAGIATKKVIINPQELARYCEASGIEPDSVGREAFAVYKSSRQED